MKNIFNQAVKACQAASEMMRQVAVLYIKEMVSDIAPVGDGFDITPLNEDIPYMTIHWHGETLAVEAFNSNGSIWADHQQFELAYHLSDADVCHVVKGLELLCENLKKGVVIKETTDGGTVLRYAAERPS